jgi:hypothetical protein
MQAKHGDLRASRGSCSLVLARCPDVAHLLQRSCARGERPPAAPIPAETEASRTSPSRREHPLSSEPSWRKGDIVNLRETDLDLEAGWACVLDFEGDELTEAWTPKTRSSLRAVPVHPLVARALSERQPVIRADGTPSPWVFPVVRKAKGYRDAKGRWHPGYGDRRAPGTSFLGKKLRLALAEAGINRRITIHDLRRTFAVLLQEAGAPDSIIRQALGHAQRTVTELSYLPRRDPLVKQWVEHIDVRVGQLENKPLPPICHQLVAEEPPGRPTLHWPGSARPSTPPFGLRSGRTDMGPLGLRFLLRQTDSTMPGQIPRSGIFRALRRSEAQSNRQAPRP